MQWTKQPVILLGHGARDADAFRVLELGVPVLSSWQAADLVDNHSPFYFGRPGIWGQRCANKILYHADLIVAIGNRLSVPQIGHDGFRAEQRVLVVDIDESEGTKLPNAEWHNMDARRFIDNMVQHGRALCPEWLIQCEKWRAEYPWLDRTHAADNHYISPYEFVRQIQDFLSPNDIVTTDMGHALTAAHQVLHLSWGQRMMTSGGLGEMGCGLPAAIGACFASDKKRVICLNSDGGMMMNLQELQTIVHHNLPIKIIVFSNDGYGMIKATQKNNRYEYAGVNRNSGVSCPDFVKVAEAFGMSSARIKSVEDWKRVRYEFMIDLKPWLVEVEIDPERKFSPKLQPIFDENHKPRSPKFDELT